MNKQANRSRRRVLVVTGSRAEFGLLRPVMDAIRKHRSLELRLCVAGEHLLGPAHTWREVAKDYRIDAKVHMQRARDRGRLDHAAATGRGLAGFAATYKKIWPDWVVVLGDRIEAFAAASAASIAGIAVCHIHGGDRAEGIADEAMRHAITKLSHLHCAATDLSAKRIVQMGERKEHVHVTGSPAIDGLHTIKPMNDSDAHKLGDPCVVMLLHPSGQDKLIEHNAAVLASCYATALGPILMLAPNSDPDREIIIKQWSFMERVNDATSLSHLPRVQFLALLKRLASRDRGALLGNSSAGLLECAAIGLPVIDLGPRQAGRERAENVLWMSDQTLFSPAFHRSVTKIQRHVARVHRSAVVNHPFGDGRAGKRIAALLARIDPLATSIRRKRNSY